MVKYCIEKYPKGSFPKQQTDGRYMDGTLHENISILAKNIVRDMTFLGIGFSSTLEVGAGKSVLFQQIGEAYTEQVNKLHGLDIPFTKDNIVFHPRDLISTALTLPKYSCIILDEWDDAHYWSELGMTLRTFFRKCRQLNLFMLIIIPNFFQMQVGYAVSRSIFAIDVKFEDNFDRGFFEFYSFKKKKDLYLKGKKTYDYDVVKADFIGKFPDGYAIGREVYLKKKREDLLKYEKEEKKLLTELELKRKLTRQFRENNPKLSNVELGKLFGVSDMTIGRWLNGENDEIPKELGFNSNIATHLINIPINEEIVVSEEEEGQIGIKPFAN